MNTNIRVPNFLQPDGIDLTKPHLGQEILLNEIVECATEKQFVIIGGSPATGKSSLLDLLRCKLEANGDEVVSYSILNFSTASTDMINLLKSYGITNNRNQTIETFNKQDQGYRLWLLIDEAQNGYSTEFEPIWSFLFKIVPTYTLKGKLFIVVASTYDETLGVSPVHFKAHQHYSPHINEDEARYLYKLHTKNWHQMSTWKAYCNNLLSLSWIYSSEEGVPPRFHIGVVIAGLYLLVSNFKNKSFTEADALNRLRSTAMINCLDRCFSVPKILPDNAKGAIVELLLRGIKSDPVVSPNAAYPYIRRGLLNEFGGFSCLAANWYYNTYFFPGWSTSPPASLDLLVIQAVASMSKHRLQRCRDQGNFPKEAAFQQLFSEEMNKLLPPMYTVLPELNTKATIDGKVVTGELDFYINSDLKWSIELLKEGVGIGEHLLRFHKKTGKYREVETHQYLVVDLRGPRSSHRVVAENPNRCTFYFEKDFSSCICKMRLEPERRLNLQP